MVSLSHGTRPWFHLMHPTCNTHNCTVLYSTEPCKLNLYGSCAHPTYRPLWCSLFPILTRTTSLLSPLCIPMLLLLFFSVLLYTTTISFAYDCSWPLRCPLLVRLASCHPHIHSPRLTHAPSSLSHGMVPFNCSHGQSQLFHPCRMSMSMSHCLWCPLLLSFMSVHVVPHRAMCIVVC